MRCGCGKGGDTANWASRHPAAAYTGVGDECEAFLAGRLAVYYQAQGRPVPPAAWFNRVVHATVADLALLATQRADVIPSFAWRRALGAIARYLLERVRETGRPIDELQRELLVPLELELIGDPAALHLEPDDIVQLALVRLYDLPDLRA